MKKIILFFAIILLNSCTTLRSVSITSIPANRNNPVTAKVSRFMFLGINFDNDFVDNLGFQLREKCKGGKISGILTKHESTFYLIGVSHEVTASGFCIKRQE